MYTYHPELRGLQAGALLRLIPAESRHLVKVRRVRKGEAVGVLDGQGTLASGVFAGSEGAQALVEIREVTQQPQATPRLVLAQALPKGGMMDTIVRHATEIGAAEIVPLYTDHTETHLDTPREAKKVARWQEIALEACKQCGNAWSARIAPPQGLREYLKTPASGLLLTASLEPDRPALYDLLSSRELPERVTYFVGPEGDFSSAEYALLSECGCLPARLSANVLRCETAALYGLSVLDSWRVRGEAS